MNPRNPRSHQARPLEAADRALIDAIVKDPGATFAQWAAMTGQSPRTIARRYATLTQAGIVRVVGRTQPGFGGRTAFIARAVGAPARLGPLGVRLAELPSARWVRLSRDRAEIYCGLVAAAEEYHEVLGLLYSHIPARDVQVSQLVSVWGQPGSVTEGAEFLDAIDEGLIALLAHDGRISAVDAARRLGVDAATISRHRNRLLRSGIVYYEAVYAPTALGSTGDFSLWLCVSPGHVVALGEHLRALNATKFVAATSGSTQIYANVVLSDASDLPAFYDSLSDFDIRGVEAVAMGHVLKQSAT